MYVRELRTRKTKQVIYLIGGSKFSAGKKCRIIQFRSLTIYSYIESHKTESQNFSTCAA